MLYPEILEPLIKDPILDGRDLWQNRPTPYRGYITGVPKGELFEGSLATLQKWGWDTTPFTTTEKLWINSPGGGKAKLLKLRQKDIPDLLMSEDIDSGFIGGDTFLESTLAGKTLISIDVLPFGACSYYLGFPYESWATAPSTRSEFTEWLKTCRIATSLPLSLQYILELSGFEIRPDQILTVTGSVEAACQFPGVNGIADLKNSGTTSQANNIRPDFQLCQFPASYLVRKTWRTITLNGSKFFE